MMVRHAVVYSLRVIIYITAPSIPLSSQGKCFGLYGARLSSCKSDGAFPSISDILGLKPCFYKENPTVSIHHTSGTLTRSRPPLRATTFDGTSLLISRKSRVVASQKVWNEYQFIPLLT